MKENSGSRSLSAHFYFLMTDNCPIIIKYSFPDIRPNETPSLLTNIVATPSPIYINFTILQLPSPFRITRYYGD